MFVYQLYFSKHINIIHSKYKYITNGGSVLDYAYVYIKKPNAV